MPKDRLPTPVFLGFPCGSAGKESACNAGELGSIPELGGSPRGGHSNPLQYSCLENPRDGGACWAAVYGVAQSWKQKQKILRRDDKNTQKNYTKKDLNDPENNDSVITHLEPDILECEVK